MCVTTDRRHNAIYVFDGTGWQCSARWTGREVTAACACGDTVICAALDDVVYLVQGAEVSEVALSEWHSDWIYGAAALSDDVVLLGGAGLILLSVKDRTATRRPLSEFNIRKPGRDILNIVNTGSRTLALGKKNLLVEYRGDSAVELIDPAAVAGKELFFEDAAELGQDLWLAGASNLRPFLARLDGGAPRFEDQPLTAMTAPALARLGNELLLGSDRLFAGMPGQWRELLPTAIAGGHSIVGFTPAAGPHPMCAVASNGRSYFTDGRSCEEIPVF